MACCVLEDLFFPDYASVDGSVVVCGVLTDEGIISLVRSTEPVAASDDEEEEEDDEALVLPSAWKP